MRRRGEGGSRIRRRGEERREKIRDKEERRRIRDEEKRRRRLSLKFSP